MRFGLNFLKNLLLDYCKKVNFSPCDACYKRVVDKRTDLIFFYNFEIEQKNFSRRIET